MKAENVLQFESLYWKLVDCEHVVDVGSELSGYTEWCMAPEAAWEVVRKGSVRGYGARVVYDSWGVGMVRVVVVCVCVRACVCVTCVCVRHGGSW